MAKGTVKWSCLAPLVTEHISCTSREHWYEQLILKSLRLKKKIQTDSLYPFVAVFAPVFFIAGRFFCTRSYFP